MNLYASREDYLEAILVLYKNLCSVDIARHYGSIKAESVCHAVNVLCGGFTKDDKHFTLTEEGRKVGGKNCETT